MGAMEGSAIGFLIKALVCQFKSAYRPRLLGLAILILLTCTRVESFMATLMVWLAPPREFLDRPALAFLLLNCVIVTIVARSKLGIGEPGHEKESERDTMRKINGKRDEERDSVAETGTEEKGYYLNTSLQRGYGQYSFGEHPLRKSWSVHACNHEGNLAKHGQANLKKVLEKKPSRIARIKAVGRTNDEVELCHPNSLDLTKDIKKKQPINRGCLSNIQYSSEPGRPPQYERSTHCLSQSAEQPPTEAAATAHPSMEEVWAAIMASNKTCLRMSCKPQAKLMHSSEANSAKSFNQRPQLNAAACKGAPIPPAPAAVALDPPTQLLLPSSWLPPAPAATAAHLQRAANAGPQRRPGVPSRPPHTSGAADGINNIQETGHESEELNRRAEEFIASFNRKMRLQREASLQSQRRGHGLCNQEVQYPEHPFALRAPARGLLVG